MPLSASSTTGYATINQHFVIITPVVAIIIINDVYHYRQPLVDHIKHYSFIILTTLVLPLVDSSSDCGWIGVGPMKLLLELV